MSAASPERQPPSPASALQRERSTALVIIPAYNEAAALPRVLAELTTALPDIDVLVVSDGSTDDTAAVARAASVAVVVLPFNLGIGGALRTGFRYAVENGYRKAVQFDADGQHDPSTVRGILAAVDDGSDLVICSRFMEGGTPTYHISRTRRLAMKALEWIVRRLVGRRFTDTSSGFRGFSESMLEFFAENYPVEYMDSVEALVIAANAGFDIREMPARISERTGGAPSTRGWRLAYYYVRLLVVLLTSYTRPAQRRRRANAERNAPRPNARAGGEVPAHRDRLLETAEGHAE